MMQQKNEMYLRPAELSFLIDDLVDKLDQVLITSTSKHRNFFKVQ